MRCLANEIRVQTPSRILTVMTSWVEESGPSLAAADWSLIFQEPCLSGFPTFRRWPERFPPPDTDRLYVWGAGWFKWTNKKIPHRLTSNLAHLLIRLLLWTCRVAWRLLRDDLRGRALSSSFLRVPGPSSIPASVVFFSKLGSLSDFGSFPDELPHSLRLPVYKSQQPLRSLAPPWWRLSEYEKPSSWSLSAFNRALPTENELTTWHPKLL